MEITDIIGKGKTFEPPFSTSSTTDSPYIIDSNGKLVAFVDYSALENFSFSYRQMVRYSIAQYFCDLLNQEAEKNNNK